MLNNKWKKKKRGTHLLKEKILPLISFPILWRSVLHRYWKYFSTQAEGICNCIYITCLSTDCTKLICQTKTFLWTLLSPLRPESRITLRATRTACVFDFSPTVAEPCFTASMAYSIWWIRPCKNKLKVVSHSLVNPLNQSPLVCIFRPLIPQWGHSLHNRLNQYVTQRQTQLPAEVGHLTCNQICWRN